MVGPQEEGGERRDERVVLAVTTGEKESLRAVAASMGLDDFSPLLRTMSLDEIVQRANRIREALKV